MPLVVQFTRDGRPTGREMTIPRNFQVGRANDIHLTFDCGPQCGDVTIAFTQDGKEIATHTAPKNAHDVGVEFRDDIDDISPGNVQVRDVHWTDEHGDRIRDYIGPPSGTNDIHIRLPNGGKFTKGRWSTNGRPWRDEWDPPVDANDFHLGPDSSRSIAIHFPKDFLFKSAGIVSAALAGRVPALSADDLTPLYQPVNEKFKTTIRAILGVSFLTGSEESLRIAIVLPGSPAEVAGLRPGDALTQIGDATVSDFSDVRDTIADLSAPVTLPITIRREDAVLKVELTPGFYIFPYQSFSSGVKFNKFCDENCDCTIDQSGFLCATVYVYVGEGPHGGVLLRKVCGAQEAGLPRLDSDCGVGEYI